MPQVVSRSRRKSPTVSLISFLSFPRLARLVCAATQRGMAANGGLSERLQAILGLRQGDRGVDVGQVGQALREVAQQLSGARIDLLREQPQVVAAGPPLVEDLPRLGQFARLREAFGQPERAAQERALVAFEPVVTA